MNNTNDTREAQEQARQAANYFGLCGPRPVVVWDINGNDDEEE